MEQPRCHSSKLQVVSASAVECVDKPRHPCGSGKPVGSNGDRRRASHAFPLSFKLSSRTRFIAFATLKCHIPSRGASSSWEPRHNGRQGDFRARPKRAAFGVAGLRYGSGQHKTNHALMSETSAGKPQPKAIPLNIYSVDCERYCLQRTICSC